MTSLISCSKQI